MNQTPQNRLFLALCKAERIPEPSAEHRFDKVRRWRFDYAWPAYLVALEVEGGAFTNGRHTRGKGFVSDMEKYSEAAAQGWRLLRVTPGNLVSTKTIQLVRRALAFDKNS